MILCVAHERTNESLKSDVRGLTHRQLSLLFNLGILKTDHLSSLPLVRAALVNCGQFFKSLLGPIK